MKRLGSACIGFALVAGVFAYADADLGFRTSPELPTPVPAPTPKKLPIPDSDYRPAPQSQIDSTSRGIQLRFQDFPLGALLQNIQHETGIRFNLSPRMAAVPVSINVAADNWEDAVRKLIADYSRVEVWTDRMKTTRVWLMESTPYALPSAALHPMASRPRPAVETVRTPFRSGPPPVPSGKQPAMSRTPIGLESLPPHVLLEPGILQYLQEKGVALPPSVIKMYGANLAGLPANIPISPNALNDPMFLEYLNSHGIEPPRA